MSKENQNLVPVLTYQGAFERDLGDVKFVCLIIGWLMLFVVVPPLAVFLLFVPSMFGQTVDAKIDAQIHRQNLERELRIRGIDFDASSDLNALIQDAYEKERIERMDASIRRAMQPFQKSNV